MLKAPFVGAKQSLVVRELDVRRRVAARTMVMMPLVTQPGLQEAIVLVRTAAAAQVADVAVGPPREGATVAGVLGRYAETIRFAATSQMDRLILPTRRNVGRRLATADTPVGRLAIADRILLAGTAVAGVASVAREVRLTVQSLVTPIMTQFDMIVATNRPLATYLAR